MNNVLRRFACASVLVLASSTANANLIDLGGGMIYDSAQDLTWMQNANVNGKMSWSAANAWAESLVFGGVDDWRLPRTMQFDDPSCSEDVRGSLFYETHVGCTGGEMEHLTAFELYDADDPSPSDLYSHLGDPFLNEPFINIETDTRYWTGTPYRDGVDPYTGKTTSGFYWQWSFVKIIGNPNLSGPFKTTLAGGNVRYAWAVRDGRAVAVPLPPSIWLVGTGLIGLVGQRRKRGRA